MGKEVFIMGYMENYKKWCEDTYFDEATKIWNLVLVV